MKRALTMSCTLLVVVRRSKCLANESIAVAYIRVSTDDQALGPEAHRAAIARWASNSNVVVVDERVDLGVSGGAALADRTGLMAALTELEAMPIR